MNESIEECVQLLKTREKDKKGTGDDVACFPPTTSPSTLPPRDIEVHRYITRCLFLLYQELGYTRIMYITHGGFASSTLDFRALSPSHLPSGVPQPHFSSINVGTSGFIPSHRALVIDGVHEAFINRNSKVVCVFFPNVFFRLPSM